MSQVKETGPLFKLVNYTNGEPATYKSFPKISRLKQLELDVSENTLVVLDIDEVLVTSLDHFAHPYADSIFTAHVKTAFEKVQSDEEHKELEKKISLSVLSTKRVMIDEDAPQMIMNSQRRGARVVGLTGWPTGPLGHIPSLEQWRIEHLRSINIHFTSPFSGITRYVFENLQEEEKYTPLFEHGILFSPGYNKGEVLKEFLKYSDFKPSNIIFVDDLPKHLENVERSMESINMPYKGYQYLGAEPFFKPIDKRVLESQFAHLVHHGKWLTDLEIEASL